ncbi:MAG: B12-binding domain-containing radical SAM protein [Alphaproteobacteria bacterium]|jgi:hypothetical protein|nr:hypothetical protein [Rhodospirillaceae bacterium]MDP6405297.1 B12-binding domain-containing radical SAM protein [Alphaproteobacteria bacterium]MDP6624124.1 B12-binding domain-containing radical SAM protein [Alphaproteobacteria bacterium]
MDQIVNQSQVPLEPAFDNARFETYCAGLRHEHALSERLLLVQIPQIVLDAFNPQIARQRGYYNFPPTGLQYLDQAMAHRGLEVRVLDLNFELMKRISEEDFDPERWPEILAAELEAFQPGVVGVGCLFDAGIGPMLTALELARSHGAVVVGGGLVASYEWQNLLAPELCHFVIEGENRINFLLDQFAGQSFDHRATPGIHFRDDEGHAETCGQPDIVEVAGDLIESYRQVPVEEYYKYGSLNPFSRTGELIDQPFAAIQLSRGCRAQCTFCAVSDFMGRGVRLRPVDDVLAEMQFLVEERGVRHFEWLDDDLLFHRQDVKRLLRGIVERGWDIHWAANNGLISASIDQETLDLIRDSGCIGFKIGIESGNAEMLKKVHKPGTLPKFRRFAGMLHSAPNIFVGGNFIVGLPDESFGQMMDSFRFALEIELDWAVLTVCQTVRGASAFADQGEYFEHQMKSGGAGVGNFVPVRKSAAGELHDEKARIRGLDVFRLPADQVPTSDQVNEVWFAFNLILNYLCNKNLRPGGRPDKFISWVETAQRAYPTNPYMNLSLALGYVLLGNSDKAVELQAMAARHAAEGYWQERFATFALDRILEDFPTDAEGVFAALSKARSFIAPHLAPWLDPAALENPTLLAPND